MKELEMPLALGIIGRHGMMRLTKSACEILLNSDMGAKRLGDTHIGTQHLLLAIAIHGAHDLGLDDGAFWATYYLCISPEKVLAKLGKNYLPESGFLAEDLLQFTANLKKALEFAAEEAIALGHVKEVTAEHLMLGITRNKECAAGALLRDMGLTMERVRETILYLLGEDVQ